MGRPRNITQTPKCCEGCLYWRKMQLWHDSVMGCHCMLDTGHRAGREGDHCPSRAEGTYRPRPPKECVY